MAHSLSSKKRIRQNETRRTENRARVSNARTQIKKVEELILHSKDIELMEKEYRATQQKLDRMVIKGNIHKNNAARKKAQLQNKINGLKAKKH
jgi:small subunit ribosomal protein S20